MITAAFLLVKGFFGSIFGFIFKDWRITLMVVVLALCGFGYYKYNSLQKELKASQATLVVEQENNKILRSNLEIATKVNKENEAVLEQLKADGTITVAAVSALNKKLIARERSVATLKAQLAAVATPPAMVSPRISIAIQGMQELRDAAGVEK